MSTRAPFVVAALVAAFPLLMLATIAPLGHAWVWNEFPRHLTMLALVLGLLAMIPRTRTLAVVLPVLLAAIAFTWELVGEYRGLAKLGRTDLLHTEMDILWDLSVARLATWLVGGLFALLAALAVKRKNLRTNLRTAAIWLAGVGAIALVFTVRNDGWLTFENLKGNGTYTTGVRWEGTQILSLVADLLALVVGLGVAIGTFVRRGSNLPPARVYKG